MVLSPDLPRVEANINLVGEVGRALAQGAAGVGLFRSEFLFLARRTFPTEEEQVDIYRKLLAALDGRPASIRTFDLRADKFLPSSPSAQAMQPFAQGASAVGQGGNSGVARHNQEGKAV